MPQYASPDYDPMMDELPPELAAEYKAEQRKQKIAALMSGQAMTPLQAPEVKGRFQGAISPMAGIAQLAQAYMSGKMADGADKNIADIGRRKQDMYSADVRRVGEVMTGRPDEVLPPDVAGPPQPGMPAGTPEQVAAAMMESKFPSIARHGFGQLEQAQKQKQIAADRLALAQENNAERAAREKENAKDRAAQQKSMAQLAASLRPAPQSHSGGGGGKPPSGYRYTPDGDLEAIPGGPADLKVKDKEQQKTAGETGVSMTLASLRDAYNRLEEGGGTTSTEKGPVGNITASISSSPPGQLFGKALGTKNQSARNDIAMGRPALLASLMKATGMSARHMDSNAELKLWLTTATDPTLDVEANRRALDNIEKKYLSPGAQGGGGAGELTPQEQSELDQLRKRFKK